MHTVIAYANSLYGKFVFDDLQVVMQNSSLMSVDGAAHWRGKRCRVRHMAAKS